MNEALARAAIDAYDRELRQRFPGDPLRPLTAAEATALGKTDLFAIVFANRSGSTLLADSLYRRGVPVPPQVEILATDLVAGVCAEEGKSSFTDYFLSTVSGWTKGGLCGFKLGPQQLGWLRSVGLLEHFRSLRVLRIQRRDRVAQAVSLFIARHTGAWHARMAQQRAAGEVAYDGAAIAAAYADIERLEAVGDAVLAGLQVPVKWVAYEALCADPEGVIDACCQFVGWKASPDRDFEPAVPPLQSQSSAVNAEFRRRFLEEYPDLAAGK